MSTCLVPKCERQSDSGICAKDEKRLAIWLSDLPKLWSLAHNYLQPGRGGTHGGSDMAIGVNVSALSFVAADDILGILHSWESVIRKRSGFKAPALVKKPESLAKEIQDAIDFALRNLSWSAKQDWAGELFREVQDTHKLGMGAAKVFGEKMKTVSCPNDTQEGLICGVDLKISESADLNSYFTCPGCHREWTAVWLMDVVLSTPGAEIWAHKEDLATRFKISEKAVMKFARLHCSTEPRGQMVEVRSFVAARQKMAA